MRFEQGHTVNKTHGMSRTKIYKVWSSMKERCLNPTHHAYASYGGRGITVCERWLVFENFFADMGLAPKGFSLDRVDNSLGYSPENCKWRSIKEQQMNTRAANYLEFNGLRLTISDWARKLGVSRNRIHTRLARGLPIEQVLNKEVIRRGRKRREV